MKSIRTSKHYIVVIQNVLMCWYLDVARTKVITWIIRDVHEPRSIFHVPKPFTVQAGRIEQHLLHSRTLYSWGLLPTGDQPHVLWPVLSFAADLSINTSWSAVYEASLRIHSSLSSVLCCAARICIYRLKKAKNWWKNARWQYLFFWPHNPLQHTFDGLFTDLEIKDIPKMINLLINIQKRTCAE